MLLVAFNGDGVLILKGSILADDRDHVLAIGRKVLIWQRDDIFIALSLIIIESDCALFSVNCS